MTDALETPDGRDEFAVPDIDVPFDMRPNLELLGIQEIERGVCHDTYENRALMRRAGIKWDTVYDNYGKPTELVMGRSEEAQAERRIMSLSEKRPLLEDPTDNNSDYLTGVALMIEATATRLAPPWVIGATKRWIKERTEGAEGRKPCPKPHRCIFVKTDGLRCMLWASGLVTDGGLCRVHLSKVKSRSGKDIERARMKITQSAPYAVDVLEELMIHASSEPVRLKSATEILDRAGVRGGVEIDISGDIQMRSAADIVSERLERLAAGAAHTQELMAGVEVDDANVIIESGSEQTE